MAKERVVDYVSGQEVPALPEEIDATQPLLRLLTALGWPVQKIRSRPQWRVPKSPSEADKRERQLSYKGYPCDIVLFSSVRKHVKDLAIICECKRPDLKSGVEELTILLGLEPHAKAGLWYNGERHAIVYRDGKGGYEIDETSPIPGPTDTLDFAGPIRVITSASLESPPSLKVLFEDIRNRVAGQDTQVNRDELILTDISTLLLCKLVDEKQKSDSPRERMSFQKGKTASETADAVRKFAETVATDYPALFPQGTPTFSIDDESIQYVVEKLQRYRLLKHDRQSVGDAFQVFRSKVVKGDEGQYFTPGPVVAAAIRILNPTSRDRIIDPACGTGGFVSRALDHVYSALEQKHGAAAGGLKKEWAQTKLYAIDKDPVSIKFCKAYLSLLDNGAHIYQGDSLRKTMWKTAWPLLSKEVKDGAFDIVLTNPPFGKDLTVSSLVGREEQYKFSRRWRRDPQGKFQPEEDWEDRQIGLVFLERCLQLLKDGGRLGIVVPETFLFSQTFAWLVEQLCESYEITHVVNLPMETFEEFCRAKTCLVFLKKQSPAPGHEIIMSFPESIGFDKRGHALEGRENNELVEAVELIIKSSTDNAVGRRMKPSKLMFRIPQREALRARNLLPQYFWREPYEQNLAAYCREQQCSTLSLGELKSRGIIEVFEGHGSTSGEHHATGPIPYVKVSDIKNWRIIENPSYCVAESEAQRLWGGPDSGLEAFDIITPARASRNIGMWAVILPDQKRVVLTREFLRFRVHPENAGADLSGIDYAFLMQTMSLKVVRDQYSALVHMQTNREDLGDRWHEVKLPIPKDPARIHALGENVRKYFEAIVSRSDLLGKIRREHGDMADWPI